MNIFLGSIYPQQIFDELLKRKQFVDIPANVFQKTLLKGLETHFTDLLVVSSPVIKSSYRDVKDICKPLLFSHKDYDTKQDIYVGTFAIVGIQLFVELWRIYKVLKNIIKSSIEKNILIIYALHSPFLLAAVMLRGRLACSCVIVPDLPEFMTDSSNFVRRFAKKIDRYVINFCLKRLDSFVLLSSYMKDKLPLKDKPWILMEGIYDTTLMSNNIQRCKERVIFYGGSLCHRYGILDLLEAFKDINKKNYRLWICGDGEAKDDVISLSEQDCRVKYFGILSHQQVLLLQKQATVLINPRNSSGEYTKFSFPSKTIEYLSSGTPTIMCHLPAIPKEYDKYIFYIDEENVEGIRRKLLEVCEMSQEELDIFGQRASEFILKEKNVYVQTLKIKNLMSNFIDGRVVY